jgi:hypothetical protein
MNTLNPTHTEQHSAVETKASPGTTFGRNDEGRVIPPRTLPMRVDAQVVRDYANRQKQRAKAALSFLASDAGDAMSADWVRELRALLEVATDALLEMCDEQARALEQFGGYASPEDQAYAEGVLRSLKR